MNRTLANQKKAAQQQTTYTTTTTTTTNISIDPQVPSGGFVLNYAPQIEDGWRLSGALCQAQVRNLHQLTAKLVVFKVPQTGDINQAGVKVMIDALLFQRVSKSEVQIQCNPSADILLPDVEYAITEVNMLCTASFTGVKSYFHMEATVQRHFTVSCKPALCAVRCFSNGDDVCRKRGIGSS